MHSVSLVFSDCLKFKDFYIPEINLDIYAVDSNVIFKGLFLNFTTENTVLMNKIIVLIGKSLDTPLILTNSQVYQINLCTVEKTTLIYSFLKKYNIC